ncbi:E3 ubiquitin protein ligase RNF170-like protein [Tanacetum coccineum]
MDAHHDETNIGIWKIEMPESSLEDKFSAPVHKWDLPNLPKILKFGSCILQVWNHGSVLQPCKCPLCRRQITLFPGEASQQVHNSEASEILNKIEAYNRLSGSQSPGHNQAKVYKKKHHDALG